MKKNTSLINLRAFTLIELLIVITIIWILATGAISVYTSQIQKARDTTRINDIKALQSAVEQVYQDDSSYPSAVTFVTQMNPYMMNGLPKDSKHGEGCSGSWAANTVDCALAYIALADENGIELWIYELSTAFENSGNRTSKAETDNGNDNLRWETGISIWSTDMDSSIDGGTVTPASWACTPAWAVAADENDVIIINGNPETAWNQCG
jgi:prepilin-type N-terminal cleavage/methylation domain-containing protein